MYRLILIFAFIYHTAGATPDTLNFKTVNQETYTYFIQQQWDSVIAVGSEALDQGIDYYYLRMRMGIAYFQKKRYFFAEIHFTKALKFNSADEEAKRYLYYCYLYSQQYELASKMFYSLSDSSNHLPEQRFASIDAINADAGEKISNDTRLYSNADFFQVDASDRIKCVSFFESYTNYTQTAYWGRVNQNDFYLKSGIPVTNGWEVVPAMHVVYVNAPPFMVNSVQFVSSISCQKSFNGIDAGFSALYSDIGFTSQVQQAISFTCHPTGDNKLALSANLMLQEDSLRSVKPQERIDITYKPISRITLYTGYYSGNAKYVSQMDGYLVNNAYTLTNYEVTFCAAMDITKHFNVYALYQYESCLDPFYNISFHYNTILAGLKYYI